MDIINELFVKLSLGLEARRGLSAPKCWAFFTSYLKQRFMRGIVVRGCVCVCVREKYKVQKYKILSFFLTCLAEVSVILQL